MPTLEVRTPEGLVLEAELAGPGSRFGAALVDAALFALGYACIAGVVLLATYADVTGLSTLIVGILVVGLYLCLGLYFLCFHLLWQGQTPGKRLFGLRVAAADGYPPSTVQHVLRALLWPIDALLPPLPPFGFLGLVVMAMTEKRQRIGDLVAGTLVLRERAPPPGSEPFPDETWSGLATRVLPLDPGLAARFDGADQELLRELQTRTHLAPDERRALFVSAARLYTERLGISEFDDARVVLKELYLFLREVRRAGTALAHHSRPR
jgi:uncharacterized RDD family membrane protein YckC